MKFKNPHDQDHFFKLHPLLCAIAFEADYFCLQNFRKELVITATLSDLQTDNKLGRVSPSHREARAMDLRTSHHFTQDEIIALVDWINNKQEWAHLHYLTQKGFHRLAYYHTGTAPHIHLALHSRFRSI